MLRVSLVAINAFTVANNTIITTNGRGIDIDGWSATPITNGEIYGNYVDVAEKKNRSDVAMARALRIRNHIDLESMITNLNIHDNSFIATSGPAEVAYGVHLSLKNKPGMDNAGIVFTNNLIKAIATDVSHKAVALDLDGIEAGINPTFNGNTFESNNISVQLADADGGSAYDVLFRSNTIRKSANGVSMTYAGISCGYWVDYASNIRFIDNRYEGGATSTISWIGEGYPKDLSMGWLLGVQVKNAGGMALAGATVRVLDKVGAQVFSGTTDANGQLSGMPIVTTVYHQSGTNPAIITTDTRGPHQIQVLVEWLRNVDPNDHD